LATSHKPNGLRKGLAKGKHNKDFKLLRGKVPQEPGDRSADLMSTIGVPSIA
jgi:hypothetical protein